MSDATSAELVAAYNRGFMDGEEKAHSKAVHILMGAIRQAVYDESGDRDFASRVVQKLHGDGSFVYAKLEVTNGR